MLPAKEAGGDFYDFFLIDEHRPTKVYPNEHDVSPQNH
jgi:hypothetical protein